MTDLSALEQEPESPTVTEHTTETPAPAPVITPQQPDAPKSASKPAKVGGVFGPPIM